MSNSSKRHYRSKLRKAGAAETRKRILDAARRQFSKKGIDKVTIDEIANEAGVSTPTVFALFQSKKGILRELMNEMKFGNRYEKLVEKALSAENPIERLRMAASIARSIYDTEKSEIGLIRAASGFSSELKTLEQEGEKLRFERQEGTVKLLSQKKLLAPSLNIKRARDILWALTGREIYRMLVLEHGWSSDEYEKWLGNELVKALTSDSSVL
ncbi:TetR/AcrR family transcriptional regulator [bacterium]|nr:TetR/AcrR family transcriptional regulator [bacterium]